MKIFAFSDTHGPIDPIKIQKSASNADIILFAGDLSDFGSDLQPALKSFSKFQSLMGVPLFLIRGNHESYSSIEEFLLHPNLVLIESQIQSHNNLNVLGIGGGGFSTRDSEFESEIERLLQNQKADIWLLHGPPYDCVVDVIPNWGPTGCKSRRKMIEQHQPVLVISGHIHDAHGTMDQIGDTVIVNPGPEGMMIELNR